MFYGFDNETKRCMWSIDMMPVVPANMTVVESEMDYDISKIMLSDNGDIVDIVHTEEELLEDAKRKHAYEMETTKNKIDTLNDVVEFTPSDKAEAELTAWRKYRAELYNMDFTSMDTVVWPSSPTAKD